MEYQVFICILSAMVSPLAFALGFILGSCWERDKKTRGPSIPELTPEQQQKLRLEGEAWRLVNSYDVADAYGMRREDEP